MKYLLYFHDGFLKQHPMTKSSITIGWSSKNDICIKDDLFSNFHVKIDKNNESFVLNDLKSTNGTYINGIKINKAVMDTGSSFVIAGREFILKEGIIEEFKLSKDLVPIVNNIVKEEKRELDNRKTKYQKDVFKELLKIILKQGLKTNNFFNFLMELSSLLSNLNEIGSVYILKEDLTYNILVSSDKNPDESKKISSIINKIKDLYKKKKILSVEIPDSKFVFNSYLIDQELKLVMLYFPNKIYFENKKKIDKFLDVLFKELSLIFYLTKNTDNTIRMDKKATKHLKILTQDRCINDLIEQSIKIASSDINVLIVGESGTGKELFARLIHNNSKRSINNYVALNCSAIPDTLLESELFGYEKGAFTGASNRQTGKIELSSGGTLILDEIGDMPLNLQVKLLRVLQEGEFYRLGGIKPIKVDLRVISLTNKNLEELILKQSFREDLYYRLVFHTIEIPPLRKRSNDITLLFNHFIKFYSQKNNKNFAGCSNEAFKLLNNYDWPGNVRQLKNEVYRLISILNENEIIKKYHLSKTIVNNELSFKKLNTTNSEPLENESEKDFVIRLLNQNQWHKTNTAKDLNITYRGLQKKIKRLGISRDD